MSQNIVVFPKLSYSKLLYFRRMYSSNYPEITPKMTKQIFKANPNKIRKDVKKVSVKKTTTPKKLLVNDSTLNTEFRTNRLNMQMISTPLYKQVFPELYQQSSKESVNEELLHSCSYELNKYEMKANSTDYLKDVDFKLPPLKGKNLEEHFFNIGTEQAKPYSDLVLEILIGIHEKPKEWIMQVGWTKYPNDPKEQPQSVPYPEENVLIFDVEVCVRTGQGPVLATAVSPKAWYGWVSQSVLDASDKPIVKHEYSLQDLIPLESAPNQRGFKLPDRFQMPKVVIGHNVSFDRARIKEQYWLQRTGLRFIDTMSLHVCVSGVTSYQRAMLKANDKESNEEKWMEYGSLNSLAEVHKLYCGSEISKEMRDIFMEGTLQDVNKDFQNLMAYCASDVVATYNVLAKLYPVFQARFPHPVTLAGMLELGSAYLPVNSNWLRYISDSEQTYNDLNIEAKLLLAQRADQACQLLDKDKYKEDIWMWNQDWSTQSIKVKKIPEDIYAAELSNEIPEELDLKPTVKRRKRSKILNETKEQQPTAVVALNKPIENKDDDDWHDEEYEELKEKFNYLKETAKYLPAKMPLLPGYPLWYRKLCNKPDSEPNWTPGPHLISTAMQVTPKLLSLTWEGFPVHFIRGKGWGFLVPHSVENSSEDRCIPLEQLLQKCPLITTKPDHKQGDDAMVTISKDVQEYIAKREYYSKLKRDKTDGVYKGSGVWCNTDLEGCCWFMKLPHKDGVSHRVGNPLAKDFLNKFSENVLAGDTESAEKVLGIARKLSYWRNNRDRIMQQMVVWLRSEDLPVSLRNNGFVYGAIIPQVVVCGTLTRRAMEPTWMTASNAQPERIGSELRAMVQAPPGYSIVGADVDSQELWIASVLGDAYRARMHGATPFGWMTLIGTKANSTDMHSVTAKAVGISRDHAKVINYARIYGAGQNFAERLLKQFNPSMTESDARNKAAKMFSMTKGRRMYQLKSEYILDFIDKPYTQWQAFQIAKSSGKTVGEIFERPRWVGGTESSMFNRLEEIAGNDSPCTPFLEGRLTRALEPINCLDDRFLPTRVNWVVQSGAVDFLHLMLVSMRWIMGNETRFCLSFHDEVRYLVPDDKRYKAALAMHVTNLLTRAFCSSRLGIYDLPQSVAFFTSVEVDTVLRKECKMDCKTPSNPHGLESGYGIACGEALDIHDAVEKANGKSDTWYKN